MPPMGGLTSLPGFERGYPIIVDLHERLVSEEVAVEELPQPFVLAANAATYGANWSSPFWWKARYHL